MSKGIGPNLKQHYFTLAYKKELFDEAYTCSKFYKILIIWTRIGGELMLFQIILKR